jgi:hypothetical protein
MLKLFAPLVTPQFRDAELAPFTVMGTVDPELVNVADPVTLQLVDSGLPEPCQVPVTVSVAVPLAGATNEMLPGTTVVVPLQVRLNV